MTPVLGGTDDRIFTLLQKVLLDCVDSKTTTCNRQLVS